jgi:hypothetical protein
LTLSVVRWPTASENWFGPVKAKTVHVTQTNKILKERFLQDKILMSSNQKVMSTDSTFFVKLKKKMVSPSHMYSLCLNFFHLPAQKPNLEKFSLVRIQTYLCRASGKWVNVKTACTFVYIYRVWKWGIVNAEQNKT